MTSDTEAHALQRGNPNGFDCFPFSLWHHDEDLQFNNIPQELFIGLMGHLLFLRAPQRVNLSNCYDLPSVAPCTVVDIYRPTLDIHASLRVNPNDFSKPHITVWRLSICYDHSCSPEDEIRWLRHCLSQWNVSAFQDCLSLCFPVRGPSIITIHTLARHALLIWRLVAIMDMPIFSCIANPLVYFPLCGVASSIMWFHW